MIDVQNLTFAYKRNRPVLTDLSFQVQKGEIFGFLGPSGAGKSTLQKILIGLLSGYQGEATVLDAQCSRMPRKLYARIGVDFEEPALYPNLTARQNLRFFGRLYGVPCFDIDQLLARLGLTEAADTRVSEYSKGMRSRLGFARAIMHNPDLLFLDEPTDGLDPASAAGMKDIIKALAQQGKTVVLTTHNMQDATELCSRVAFLVDGKLAAVDTPHRLIMRKGAASLTYTYLDQNVERTVTVPKLQTGQDKLLLALVQSGALQSIHSDEPTLSDVFCELTGRRLS